MNNMIKVCAPQRVKGEVRLPSSKSICNRALIINSLAGNDEMPQNLSDCDDTRVMVDWLTSRPDVIDIGAAGTAMRFSTALLAVTKGTHVITGTERMKNRPVSVLVDALRQLGADVRYVEKDGFPPLSVTGNEKLPGGDIELSGSVSSQYVSALLMIAPVMSNGLRLVLQGNVVSRPYIDMTISLMSEFGADVRWETANSIVVRPVAYKKRQYYVESDWSAASYWYEMTALTKDLDVEITLPGLHKKSLQGDSKVADLFGQLGVETSYSDEGVTLRKCARKTDRLEYDFVEIPDLAQTFVVTCCMLGIPFHFTGLQSLKIKETDRIEALKCELRKLGYLIQDSNDSELSWNGEKCDAQAAPAIDTYEDHRMAMAFAPCALCLGEININNPQVVSKSYPGYWDDLKSVGFAL